jgi:hypothetical protein
MPASPIDSRTAAATRRPLPLALRCGRAHARTPSTLPSSRAMITRVRRAQIDARVDAAHARASADVQTRTRRPRPHDQSCRIPRFHRAPALPVL